MTEIAETHRVQCPKCGSYHGNDWSQCNGNCPMPMSPHYKASRAHLTPSIPLRDGAKSVMSEELMMHAERLYDEGGQKTVPTIIVEAILAERERWLEVATELADLMDDVVSGNYTPDSFTTQPIRRLIGEA